MQGRGAQHLAPSDEEWEQLSNSRPAMNDTLSLIHSVNSVWKWVLAKGEWRPHSCAVHWLCHCIVISHTRLPSARCTVRASLWQNKESSQGEVRIHHKTKPHLKTLSLIEEQLRPGSLVVQFVLIICSLCCLQINHNGKICPCPSDLYIE